MVCRSRILPALAVLLLNPNAVILAAGFPNVAWPEAGALLSGLNGPTQGRTAIIAFHNGILYTAPEGPDSFGDYDLQARSWDISDPENPVMLELLGVSRQPINAHGFFHEGPRLILGDNTPAWTFEATATYGVNNRIPWADLPPDGVGDRGRLFFPYWVGPTWWTYGEVSGWAVLERDNVQLATWDHLGLTGVIGHPFIVGNLLIYASDQSRTGVAVYDISDPSEPTLLDVLTHGGPGGYWPELWGGDGRLYVVWPYRTFGHGMRVVDITDPTDLRWVIDLELPGDEPMYAQFQDEFAFIANHKIDMRTFEVVLSLDSANAAHTVLDNPNANPARTGIDTSQFALPLGNLLVTGGVGQNQGMAIWVHDTLPDQRGPEVGYHIPRAGQTHYPLSAPISLLIHETLETATIINGTTFLVRPLDAEGVPGAAIDGRVVFAFNDILTFTPTSPPGG